MGEKVITTCSKRDIDVGEKIITMCSRRDSDVGEWVIATCSIMMWVSDQLLLRAIGEILMDVSGLSSHAVGETQWE